MPERIQIDPPSPKADALRLEEEALFQSIFAGEQNTPTRTKYALPGQIREGLKYSRHLPRAARKSGSRRYGAVGGDLAARNRTDRGSDSAGQ